MPVYFHSESVNFNLKHKLKYKSWLLNLVASFKKKVGELNFIFVDDKKLLQINVEYLKHNYYTDIITFNYNNGNVISGDIFISIERVRENSNKFNTSFQNELSRVMVHGVLHLLGFDDSTKEEKAKIREMEEKSLSVLDIKV